MKKFPVFLIVLGFFCLPQILRAQSIDLLSQGETYTPPFFQGRALWTKQGSAIFVAIPQGLGTPSELNYRWSKNGTILGSLSGVGKNTLRIFDNALSKSVSVKVEILGEDRSILASATSNLTPVEPKVIIYENHPLFGFLFNLETYSGYPVGKEVGFTAFPLFFDVTDRLSNSLSYEWDMNSQAASREPGIVFRAPEEGAGSASVKTRIKHSESIFQKAEAGILLNFEGDE